MTHAGPERPRVLIVYSAPHRGDALLRLLQPRFDEVVACSPEEAVERFRDGYEPSVVVCETLSKSGALVLRGPAEELGCGTLWIVVTDSPDAALLERAEEGGGLFAFVRPNWLPHEVEILVSRACEAWAREQQVESLSAANVRQQSQLHRVVAERTAELEHSRHELAQKNSELRRKAEEVEAANRRLKRIASTDGLTGLYNHRYFQVQWRREVTLAQRYGDQLSLMVLDLDRFKNFNDSVGHPAGDELLRVLARLLISSVRAVDLVARYGGEEFVIMLPRTSKAAAVLLADRIRAAVEAHPFEHREVQPGGRVTITIGVASYPDDGAGPNEVLARADRAMYRAKKVGRNAVLGAAPADDTASAPAGGPEVDVARLDAERRELEELIGDDDSSED